jgi:hypothetical protein
MNQPASAASMPTLSLRQAFDWWLTQVRHVFPPTIFFFAGFNLILWTKHLILREHDIDFSGFVVATLAALLVGKAVLITDNLSLMHRLMQLLQNGDLLGVYTCRAARGEIDLFSRWRRLT